VNDACKNLYDTAVIFSNDSDLEEAVKIVKGEYHKTICLVNPHIGGTSCRQLNQLASFHGRLTQQLLSQSQLPDTIPGTSLHKPREWY
jgi:hypothetical protein